MSATTDCWQIRAPHPLARGGRGGVIGRVNRMVVWLASSISCSLPFGNLECQVA
jgi:hypothetical protein